MNTLKNAAVIVLLVGVGYGVYVVVNRGADPPPPGLNTQTPPVSMSPGTEAPAPNGPNWGGSPSGSAPSSNGNHASSLPHRPVPSSLGHPDEAVGRDGSASLTAPPLSPPASPTARAAVPSPRTSDSAVDPIHDARHDTIGPARAADGPQERLSSDPGGSKDSPTSPPSGGNEQSPRGTFADAWAEAQDLLAAQKLVEAHAKLSLWYADPRLTPAEDDKLTDVLGQLAGTIIYSSSEHLLEKPYVVKPTDTIDSIAMAYYVTPKLLAKINGLDDPKAIRAGDTLKVIRGPFHAVVHISREEISLQLEQRYAGRFRIVRTGNDFRLPQKPVIFPVSQKANAHGEHWIGLDKGYAIHADAAPAAGSTPMPGRDSIAINSKDAEDLFDILTVDQKYGSQVGIMPREPSFR
jgi:LysM repeat protein